MRTLPEPFFSVALGRNILVLKRIVDLDAIHKACFSGYRQNPRKAAQCFTNDASKQTKFPQSLAGNRVETWSKTQSK
jgi:hypothetical protein